MYGVGDHVFAHIRGHTPWPAIVSKVEIKGRITIFYVDFFGKKKEKGQCSSSKLYAFEENKKKFAVGKIMEDREFAQAVKEIEKDIKYRKNKSSLSSPMKFNSSTPNVSKLNLDCTASFHNASLILVDKSVNTTFELDQTVQLEALTEKCIDLEKKGIQYEEKCSLFKEIEKTLKTEIENLKKANLELKQNLKNLKIKQVSKPLEQHDFQTQIVIEELRLKKLENESLKAASNILQEENNLLENKLETLKTSSSNCFRCFPSMTPLQSSLNMTTSASSWTHVKQSKRKDIRPKNLQSLDDVPCVNRFSPLVGVTQEVENEGDFDNFDEVQPDILICGDSHGRDLAYHLNKKLKSSNAFGFVQPGGCTKDILNDKKIRDVNLKEKDVLVLMCGTNDVARNKADEALNNINQTLGKFSHTNIILVDLPHRYDLVEWSCVNTEVKKTNLSLRDLIKKHPNITLVEASKAGRNLHTRHGLHLNYRGKTWLAETIAEAIVNMKAPEQGVIQEQPPPPGIDTTSAVVDLSENSPSTIQQSNP